MSSALVLVVLMIVLFYTVMHAQFYLNLPSSGVTGVALHLLSTWMMPVMWEALLILLAYMMMVIPA